ncbi:MAG: hypothetical protein ABJG68_12835 [Crocinitomicaceae bacterium]
MKRFKLITILAILLLFGAKAGYSQEEPSADHNYLVLYIETYEKEKLQALIDELEACEGKIVSVNYIESNSELFVTYTDAMRDDTIHQIVYKYFTNIKKVRGTNIVEYE